MSRDSDGPDVLPAVLRDPVTSVEQVWDNVRDYVTHGHLADTRRMPRTVVRRGDGYVVHRYTPRPDAAALPGAAPLLLVPPLGAPDFAFDLRRGASLVEDLLGTGRDATRSGRR